MPTACALCWPAQRQVKFCRDRGTQLHPNLRLDPYQCRRSRTPRTGVARTAAQDSAGGSRSAHGGMRRSRRRSDSVDRRRRGHADRGLRRWSCRIDPKVGQHSLGTAGGVPELTRWNDIGNTQRYRHLTAATLSAILTQCDFPQPCFERDGVCGVVWTWIAIDADTNLIPSWMIGQRHASIHSRPVMLWHACDRDCMTQRQPRAGATWVRMDSMTCAL